MVWILRPARSSRHGVSVKSTLLLMLCIHNFNSCVRCKVWLCICFTSERCNMSSINKRSTRVGAKSKKSIYRKMREVRGPVLLGAKNGLGVINSSLSLNFFLRSLLLRSQLISFPPNYQGSWWLQKGLKRANKWPCARAWVEVRANASLFQSLPLREIFH